MIEAQDGCTCNRSSVFATCCQKSNSMNILQHLPRYFVAEPVPGYTCSVIVSQLWISQFPPPPTGKFLDLIPTSRASLRPLILINFTLLFTETSHGAADSKELKSQREVNENIWEDGAKSRNSNDIAYLMGTWLFLEIKTTVNRILKFHNTCELLIIRGLWLKSGDMKLTKRGSSLWQIDCPLPQILTG